MFKAIASSIHKYSFEATKFAIPSIVILIGLCQFKKNAHLATWVARAKCESFQSWEVNIWYARLMVS